MHSSTVNSGFGDPSSPGDHSKALFSFVITFSIDSQPWSNSIVVMVSFTAKTDLKQFVNPTKPRQSRIWHYVLLSHPLWNAKDDLKLLKEKLDEIFSHCQLCKANGSVLLVTEWKPFCFLFFLLKENRFVSNRMDRTE